MKLEYLIAIARPGNLAADVAFHNQFGYTDGMKAFKWFGGKKSFGLEFSWDTVAEHYAERYRISMDEVHYGPLCPGESLLGLLGNLDCKKVLDLGCGAGQNAIALAKMGASVLGIDFSTRQIKIAEALAEKEGQYLNFVRGDISNISKLKSSSFDLVLSACAIAFVENISATFSGAYRVLKRGGRFILSDMHPLQYILDESGSGVKFNNRYPFEPILVRWRWDFENLKKNPPFKHYVRSVSDYHNALVQAGFNVSRIIEPEPTLDTPHKGFSDEIMREYPYIAKHLPITFIMIGNK